MKKLIALLLALLLPVAATAQVTVAGTDISAGGYWTTDGSATLAPVGSGESWHIHYDANSATLTLNGANVTAAQGENGIVADSDLTVVLAAGSVNAVTSGVMPKPAEGSGETWQEGMALSVDGDLVIRGKGTLNLTAESAGSAYGLTVLSHGGNGMTLTITDATVTAVGKAAGAFSKGVFSHGSVTLSGAVLTAISGESGLYSYALDAAGVTAVSSVVTARAGHAAFQSLGVYASMNMTDCTLNVAADPTSRNSNGMAGNYTQTGGTAEFTGVTGALELGARGLTLSDELVITGADTPDGALGDAVLASDGKRFVVGTDPAGGIVAQRLRIAPAEKDDEDGTVVPPAVPAPPATGDGAHPALWLGLMVFAGAAAVAARRRYN